MVTDSAAVLQPLHSSLEVGLACIYLRRKLRPTKGHDGVLG